MFRKNEQPGQGEAVEWHCRGKNDRKSISLNISKKLVDRAFVSNSESDNDTAQVESMTDQIEQLQNEIEQVKTCQICYYPFDDDVRVPAKGKCPHALYCMECLEKTARRTGKCPTCRARLKLSEIVEVKLNFKR